LQITIYRICVVAWGHGPVLGSRE